MKAASFPDDMMSPSTTITVVRDADIWNAPLEMDHPLGLEPALIEPHASRLGTAPVIVVDSNATTNMDLRPPMFVSLQARRREQE